MKKGILFVAIFAIIISIVLIQMQNISVITGTDGTKTIQTISDTQKVTLNEFISGYKANQFEKIDVINNETLAGYTKVSEKNPEYAGIVANNILEKKYSITETFKPTDSTLSELGISLTGTTQVNIIVNKDSILQKTVIETLLPIIIIGTIFYFALKFFGGKGGGFPIAIKVGKLKSKTDKQTKFSDIAGMEEVKHELRELVDYLKNPEKYKKVGARPPKGVLLYGLPGSGKTLLARAVAGEANVPFFSASGSEFMEMLVGMGAAKVRELFGKARAASPSIVFIDEIDAIGRRRGSGHTGGHQEQEQTLNQILTEMDGFDNETNVIVIAATNRADTLDPALVRPGRFDRKVMVGRPTLEERVLIIEYYLKNKKVGDNVDLNTLAKRTTGFVGADIENLINEASLKLARESREVLESTDFEFALEKIIMGPEKKIKSIQETERKIIALHELGHAVTSYFLKHGDPVEKISIVSRGMALGVTRMMPEEDKYLVSKAKFLDEMVTLLGGRAAEEVFFGKENITTGASNDFEKVRDIAVGMITKYGMDEEMGPVLLSDYENTEQTWYKLLSEKTAELVDTKVKQLVKDSYNRAVELIKKNKPLIQSMSEVLLLKEYFTKEEFESIMKDESVLIQLKKEALAIQKLVVIDANAVHVPIKTKKGTTQFSKQSSNKEKQSTNKIVIKVEKEGTKKTQTVPKNQIKAKKKT